MTSLPSTNEDVALEDLPEPRALFARNHNVLLPTKLTDIVYGYDFSWQNKTYAFLPIAAPSPYEPFFH
jgi:hypothetical protein